MVSKLRITHLYSFVINICTTLALISIPDVSINSGSRRIGLPPSLVRPQYVVGHQPVEDFVCFDEALHAHV